VRRGFPKREPTGVAEPDSSLVRVDDGIPETAHMTDNRDRATSEGIELG
jgi:hypothetical protein